MRKNLPSLSPSHSVAKETIDLAVVGKEGANVLLRGRRLETGQIAQTGDGVFAGFDKVDSDVGL